MDREFVRHWVLMNFLGAGLGGLFGPLGTECLRWFATESPGIATQLPGTVVIATMGLLGLLEGGVLGILQARALRKRVSSLVVWRWTLATGWGFLWGWVLNALTSAGPSAAAPSVAWIWVTLATNGMLLGVCVGGAQAWLLRDRIKQPLRWMALNTLGWMAALTAQHVGQNFLPPGLEGPLWILAAAATSSIGGFILGALTGPWLDQTTR